MVLVGEFVLLIVAIFSFGNTFKQLIVDLIFKYLLGVILWVLGVDFNTLEEIKLTAEEGVTVEVTVLDKAVIGGLNAILRNCDPVVGVVAVFKALLFVL